MKTFREFLSEDSQKYQHPMIDVDGVMKHRHNSEGRPIHPTDEGIKNFHRWFGDSKIVDEHGRPRVVYHGSPDLRFMKDDASFKSQRERLGIGSTSSAHWFTTDFRTAKSYADPRRAFDYQNAEEGVIQTYLKINTPLTVDAGGGEWRNAQKRGQTGEIIQKAQKNGNDGVIVNNVKDDYNNVKTTKPTRTFTVFSGTQIKSATGNNGDFAHPTKITESV